MWGPVSTRFIPTPMTATPDKTICFVPLANSTNAVIHPCPWSDHQVTSLNISHIGLKPSVAGWRLNESLLKDPILVSQISKHMEEYFATNNTNDISPTVLWAAHKVVIRGHLIQIATNRKKQRLVDITRLTAELISGYRL